MCGSAQSQLGVHIRTHGIDTHAYQLMWPDAPIQAEASKPYRDIGDERWDLLDTRRQTLIGHSEWLEELEDTWVFQTDNVFSYLVDAFNSLAVDGQIKQHDFRVAVAGSLYLALKDQIPSIDPGTVAELTGQDASRLYKVSKKSDFTPDSAPDEQLWSKIQSVRGMTDDDEYEAVMEWIDALPEDQRYGRSPSIVVATALYRTGAMKQYRAAEVMDVTDAGIRNFQQTLDDAQNGAENTA